MWHDIEAEIDLLNFKVVADAAAQLVRDAHGHPLTIGISGGWGVGKSSLVKMVAGLLRADSDASSKFIFLEFNAWLYQGYDDARQALLQAVSDELITAAKAQETLLEKAWAFRRRVRWLKLSRLVAPAFMGGVAGTALGPVGTLVGAVGGLLKGASDVSRSDEVKEIKKAYEHLEPDLVGLIKDKEDDSLPKEIQGLRDAFEELLKDLKVTLVVLVDDLDRCLPNTAIATLEAMRLLLHVRGTAFIIAADEQMIRGAVKAHFGEVDINDDLVTSYFDKLIQVPLRVPRLGVNEVKTYVMLLLADLATRQHRLTAQAQADGQTKMLEALKNSWTQTIDREMLEKSYGAEASKITREIEAAETLAAMLVTAEQISGNPRLIKRFLNNLMLRDTIARAQNMSVGFEELVKMQLFERCASPAAFDFLVQASQADDNGKPAFLGPLESAALKGDAYAAPTPSWGTPFYEQWVRLPPQLADVSLKPFLYLSRDRSLAIASYDELSAEARKVFEGALKSEGVLESLVGQIKGLGEAEADRVLIRLMRKARTEQWSGVAVSRCFNVPKAFESLGAKFAAMLAEIPPAQRPPAIGPLLLTTDWGKSLASDWAADPNTPQQFKNLFKNRRDKS